MGKQVQRMMLATSASLSKGELQRLGERSKALKLNYLRPQTNLNNYEGDIGSGGFHTRSVKKPANT